MHVEDEEGGKGSDGLGGESGRGVAGLSRAVQREGRDVRAV